MKTTCCGCRVFFIVTAIALMSATAHANDPHECGTTYDDAFVVDAWPVSEYKPDVFPSEEEMRLIGRVADGIIKFLDSRTPGDKIIWAECGQMYESEGDLREAASDWAWNLVRVSKRFKLNVWGVAALCFHESADRCAIGPHPRNWAYKTYAPWGGKLLKKSRRTISHSREDILRMLGTDRAKRRWAQTGVDIGPGQLLSRYYPGQVEDMMTLNPGLDIVGETLANFARRYRTKRPWALWRGRMLAWYDERVTKIARRMGASWYEIGRPIKQDKS